MSLRKNYRIEDRRTVHTWVDEANGFKAEVYKDEYMWTGTTTSGSMIETEQYQRAVDFVMDEWRLSKSGYASWEEAAAAMAEGDWDALSDDEQQDLIDAAREMARRM